MASKHYGLYMLLNVNFHIILNKSWYKKGHITKILVIRQAEPDYKNNTLTKKGFVTGLVTEERVKGEFVFKCKQMGDTSHLYINKEPISNAGLYGEFYGGDGTGAKV